MTVQPSSLRLPMARLSGSLLTAGVISLFLACLIGSTPMAAGRVFAALVGVGDQADGVIIWQIRLPRALAAWLTGFVLGVSGAALQGLLRNPLAEPGVLGVSATACLGATTVIYYGLASAMGILVPVAAIGGALLATGGVAVAARRTRSVVSLILVGVGLSSFAGAVMALLVNLAPNPFTLTDMITWTMGSVANRSMQDIALVLPFMLAGCLILWVSRRGLSALTLGEEGAAAVGVDLARLRLSVVIGTGLATGAAVALAGVIGFLGIVTPHLIRPLVAHDPARSLLPAGLLAGLILVFADILVRLVPTNNELRLGVVAALIGAPVFVWIVVNRRMVHD